MANAIFLSVVITGFSGVVAQIILLRELFVVFQGNELSIGVVLANWLILEAFGSFWLGKRIKFVSSLLDRLLIFIIAIMVFSMFLPVSVYFVRALKILMGISVAEGVGIITIFWASFIALLPLSVIHGALFTFGCRLSDEVLCYPSRSITKTYIYETLGTAVGGVVFGYVLVRYLNSFYIVFLVMLINILYCIYLSGVAGNRALIISNIATFLVGIYLIFTGGVEKLHIASLNTQWQNHRVVYSRNSVYGNITVIQNNEQLTFMSNGMPVITTPIPDIVLVEDSVHFAMLTHPEPRRVLVISGGAGGRIFELLKYKSLERIDYVELDPLLLETLKNFPTTLTQKELSSEVVRTHYVDGVLFVKSTREKYDLIFVGVSDIMDLLSNRFHTVEFYRILKDRLSERGIVSLNIPGSLIYLSNELAQLNASILKTLQSVFPAVKVIPGDFNVFLCSNDKEVLKRSSQEIYTHLVEREIKSNLFTSGYIGYRLDKKWSDWFFENLKKVKAELNYDFKPMAMFYNLSYWSAKFSPVAHKIFVAVEKIRIWLFVVFFLVLVLSVLVVYRISKNHISSFAIPYAIGTTGFAGMLFDLTLIFGFQVLYGYVYHQIGLLISFFMAGAIIGSGIVVRLLPKVNNKIAFFIRQEFLVIIFAMILVSTMVYLRRFNTSGMVISQILPVLFLVLSFMSGFLVGMEFPLGVDMHLSSSKDMTSTAGLIYASDLLGGVAGGILGGVVMLPVLGVFQTIVILIILKLTSIIFLYFTGR